MKQIVLYFGSFNPIHKGHTAVAEYVVEGEYCDELWFVVSPRNPLKPAASLAPDSYRLRMAEIAVAEMSCGDRVKVCDVEFGLPKPSYTIDTVRALMREYPDRGFSILVGADIMEEIERWKEYRALLAECHFLVYPRDGYGLGTHGAEVVFLKNAPKWDYSSTTIRESLAEGRDVSSMVSGGVLEYIKEHKLWI